MKVSIFSESPADEAGILKLVNGVFGSPMELVSGPRVRSRGWAAVFNLLPVILKHLHFQTDADAVVLVIDSDFEPVHLPAHDDPDGEDKDCRLCDLRRAAVHVQSGLRPVPNRYPLKVAIGMAVPAIEAWYLFGKDRHVSEAAWITGLQTRKFPYTKQELKRSVYGTDRPSLELETACAIKESERVSNSLDGFEAFFPNGFGPLARAVRSWRT
jgi:hypothetical protein